MEITLKTIPYDGGTQLFVTRLKEILKSDDGLLIEDLPCEQSNTALVKVATFLGDISSHGLGRKQVQFERGGVQRIEPLAKPVCDKNGFPLLSTTSEAFPLHMDDAFSPVPIDYVLFHCWRPADYGGETLWALLSDIITAMAPSTLRRLQTVLFPWEFGKAPLITNNAGEYRIRYNEYELNKQWQLKGQTPSEEQKALIMTLKKVFTLTEQNLKMKKGDCIIFHNCRVLHGRTAIASGTRLLKRVRVQVDSAS